jgi:site-specific DNA recombinase
MEKNNKVKVAPYCRISPSERGKEGTSIENQLYLLRRAADYYGWEVYKEYVDELRSGTKVEGREALSRLMLDAKAGRFEKVAATKLDRFFRNLRLLLNYIDELDQAGVTFVSTSEGFDTSTPQGRFTLKIMGIIAEWERDRIVERTTEGRYQRYREGKWGPGQPLYGYRYNPQTKHLDIREDEADVVRRVYHLYVYDRLGFEQIARLLNSESIPPRQGANRWHKSAIRDIITHPGYKGEHPAGVKLDAIVSPSLWLMAQERRKGNRHLHRREGSSWLLQARIVCGLDGRILSCAYSHGKNGRRVYSCPARRKGTYPDDRHRCTLPILDADWLEDEVRKRVRPILKDPKKLADLLAESIQQLQNMESELARQLVPVQEQLAAIRAKRAKLAEDWVMKSIEPQRMAELRSSLEKEEERLSNIEREIDPAQIEELHQTQETIKFWSEQLQSMEAVQTDQDGLFPRETTKVIRVLALHTGAYQKAHELGDNASQKLDWPLTLPEILDRLQAKLIAFPDRVEVKAIFPIDAIGHQESDPVYRLSHCPQSL